jgi:phosphotransferase system, enzyme I, PtsP
MSQTEMSGHRRALRRLRRIMAGSGTPQERLDRLVKVIAEEMAAEVCSVYVMRAGEVLELFATEGLNPSAVHQTRLRVGEGLVGTVAATARPLNLPDAQSHPQFSYRPETGEEIYRSLLGVPILRGGRVRGVLVIQNQALRVYEEEEAEALEVIAVVMAELIAGGELISPVERTTAQGNAILPTRLTGVKINGGLAIGEAVLHMPRVGIHQMFADDPADEHLRLADALSSMHTELDGMLELRELSEAGEHRDVIATYRQFAEDRGWVRRIREAIDGGLTAEAAVQKVQEDSRARMAQISDPYLRERLHDLEDLANRLVQHLTGTTFGDADDRLPDQVVLLARNIGPAELLDYDPRRLRGLLLEEGSPTSHVAIVARALNIPVIGMVEGLLSRIDPMDPVVADGENAQIFVRPGEDILQMVANNIGLQERRRVAHAAMRDEPAVTPDGIRISLNVNAGLLMDLQGLDESGADGIGLYRTEIPFMVRAEFPDVDSQVELYRNVLDRAGGRPVVFRTLDIGGDKQLPYFRDVPEENPAMGWRAIRVGLDRPGMLRRQLRALIRAADGRDLSVMFPMVAEVAEFKSARNILDIEIARERMRGGKLPSKLEVGVMLEVPGLMWQLDALLTVVDFLSVGSNDLFQFLFATDRGNPRVADRYDVLSPGLLSLLRSLVERCEHAGVSLSLCGEMAGRPIEAMALIGMGFRSISMPPATIGAVKSMVRSLSVEPLRAYLETLYNLPDRSLREKLRAFSRDHGVVIEDM